MRYSLWVNILEDKYIHCVQATNIELLQEMARTMIMGSYIFDHVRHVLVWPRYKDGREEDIELEILREAFHRGNSHVDFNKTQNS